MTPAAPAYRPVVVDPIGGQAVVEGVMMRTNAGVSVAVRDNQGKIVLRYLPLVPWRDRHPMLRWPIVRGVATLGESLTVGFKMLEESAAIASGASPGEASKGAGLPLVLGIVLAIALFAVLPAWVYTHLPQVIGGRAFQGLLAPLGSAAKASLTAALLTNVGRSAIEGVFRLAVFVGYLGGIGTIPDVKRLFEYHGAEHQVIKCHEAGLPLEAARARAFSPLHPRCGTSFLLVTMVLGILVFSFIPQSLGLAERVLCKIALLPVVAGLSYEVIRLAGKASAAGRRPSPLARLALFLTAPGLWLQRLTTRPAPDEMLEVAIASLTRALQSGAEFGVP